MILKRMIPLEERIILSKIKPHDPNNKKVSIEDVHEQDNIPNPFQDLTLEELYFLREHKHLLEKIKL